MKNFLNEKRLFILIFLLAAFFRLLGTNWDQNQHLHPDERFLTMVSGAIKWPQSINQYIDSATSPLNPHNMGFPFFVYGTFPIFLTKFIAESMGSGDYNNLTLIGRQLSAFFDLGTVILVFLIAKSLKTPRGWQAGVSTKAMTPPTVEKSDNWIIGLFAAYFYAAAVLPIQLSHFYAVDTYLTFFLTLSFYVLIKFINWKLIGNCLPAGEAGKLIGNYAIPLGIAFGLALASKISAILFFPIIALGFLIFFIKNRKTSFIFHCGIVALFIVSVYFTLRLSQPYLFANPNIFDFNLNHKVLDNWKQLKSFEDPNGWFPPAIQWIKTKPYIFPLKNLIFWGLGLPLGIISIFAVLYYTLIFCHSGLSKIYKKSGFWSRFAPQNDDNLILYLSLLCILLLFIYQGSQFVKAMRYFFPIYPFLAILSAWFLVQTLIFIQSRYRLKPIILALLHSCIVALIILYPLSFISIYSHPHSRITASDWIYNNIPKGKVLANEYWDDPLPLYRPLQNPSDYPGIMLPLYDQDTKEKWTKLSADLEKIDYIILSSNRLYGSILTVPENYPLTKKYYDSLFDGSLGFEKVAEFTSRPNLPFPGIKLCLTPPFIHYGIIASEKQECTLLGISFVDDYADESFTVYDHPKVIIFKKVKSVDYSQILGKY